MATPSGPAKLILLKILWFP